eukprot:gene14428-12978_t
MPIVRILGEQWSWADKVCASVDTAKKIQQSMGALRKRAGGEGAKARPAGPPLDVRRSFDAQGVRGALWFEKRDPSAPREHSPA